MGSLSQPSRFLEVPQGYNSTIADQVIMRVCQLSYLGDPNLWLLSLERSERWQQPKNLHSFPGAYAWHLTHAGHGVACHIATHATHAWNIMEPSLARLVRG